LQAVYLEVPLVPLQELSPAAHPSPVSPEHDILGARWLLLYIWAAGCRWSTGSLFFELIGTKEKGSRIQGVEGARVQGNIISKGGSFFLLHAFACKIFGFYLLNTYLRKSPSQSLPLPTP
jgi:hypothetical protein